MPLRSGSRMRRERLHYHGWKDKDGKFCLSVQPREKATAANRYETAGEALAEASKRHLPIRWEDTSVVS